MTTPTPVQLPRWKVYVWQASTIVFLFAAAYMVWMGQQVAEDLALRAVLIVQLITVMFVWFVLIRLGPVPRQTAEK